MQNNGKKSRALYMLLSIVIAIAFWVYVDNNNGGTKVIVTPDAIPIDFVGENTTLADRGLMLLGDSDQTVTLKLEATRKVIARLDTTKIRIQADLSGVTATGWQKVNYKILYPSTVSSSSITVTYASAYTVSVDIGELYSREVPIHCEVQGKVADGYIAGELSCQPSTLELRGDEGLVDQVSYAKVILKIDNAESTVSQMLDYHLYDANDQIVDSDEIHATSSQIKVTLPVNVVKELPLTIKFDEAPGSSLSNVTYSIQPSTVTVSGDASVLKNVNSIVLDEFDLSSLESSAVYNYVIKVPKGCENLSGVTRATMKIAFKDLTTATLAATQFECENIPDGKQVEILTSELNVTLRGPAADVAKVIPEDLLVTADLKDISSASGSYTVPAKVTVKTEGDIGTVGDYQIKITIS